MSPGKKRLLQTIFVNAWHVFPPESGGKCISLCVGARVEGLLLLYPPDASGGYFGLAFAMPPLPPCVERFLALTLSEENCTS